MFVLLAADPAAPHWAVIAAGLVAIPVLVAVNGFFVAAEFSLVAVRKTQVEEMVNQGVPRAKAVSDAVTNLDQTIAATQLGITLASIALGWVGESVMEHLLRPAFAHLPDHMAFISRHTLSVGVAFSFVTFMHVVFGELIPKAIALQTPGKVALWVAGPLNLFARVARPVLWVMNGTANWLIRRLGYRPSGEDQAVHSVDELRLLIEDTEEAGLIDAEAADYVLNVFELSSKTVRDVMIPWDKVSTLDLDTSPERVLEAVREGAHTRMPVTAGTDPPQVVGLVNTKDLFYLFSLRGVVVLEDAIYPAQYLAPTDTVANALRRFRKSHRPMAVVREADGPPLGVLTLEDVLEEIVGDIEDEQDDPARRRQLRARAARRRGR